MSFNPFVALLGALLFVQMLPAQTAVPEGASPTAVSQTELSAWRTRLLEGVKPLGLGGGAVPGSLLLLGSNSAPLAVGRYSDGSTAVVAATALYGKGKVLALAHDGFLRNQHWLGGTQQLLQNFLNATQASPDGRTVVLRCPSAARGLEQLQGANVVEVSDLSSLQDSDLLVAANLRAEEIPTVLQHVAHGGNLLVANLGWGFLYFHPGVNFAEAFVDNRLTGRMGILASSATTERINNRFPLETTLPPGATADSALEAVTQDRFSNQAHRKQVSQILTLLVSSLPRGCNPALEAKLLQLTQLPAANKVPSPQQPLGSEATLARLAIVARQNAWQANPTQRWEADPAAESYPGAVKANTPSVKRSVEINLAIPRWHSTGVYAVPGRPITVEIPPEAYKANLKVRIGSAADNLTTLDSWKRAPLVTVEYPLKGATTTITSPFGGLVYLVVPNRPREQTITATIKGGIMAPWFRLGIDSPEKFRRDCANTGAPYGEIQGKHFIISAETAGLKQIKDPEWIARYWDKVVLASRDLAQCGPRPSPERICSDVQLISGWMHDGYPIMTHINDAHLDWVLDEPRMDKGHAWGVYHEIGHNHQERAWTPSGTGEVTVNLFTCHTIETVCGGSYRDTAHPTATASAKRRVERWVRKGKRFADWQKDPFLALEVYLRIREVYGWEVYKKTFARYRQPGFLTPKSDEQRWQTFAIEMSKSANANLAEVLAAWSIPIKPSTLDACKHYPKAPASLTAGLNQTPYQPPQAEPVKGEYVAVTLCGASAGSIDVYATAQELPAPPTDERWKTTHLLFKRIEPTVQPVTLGNAKASAESWDAPHQVEITKPYYFGVYELTQAQYANITGFWRKKCFGGPQTRATRPVNAISYEELRGGIKDGIRWPQTGHQVAPNTFLSILRELIGFRAEIDLPTEAQWEYAARAGTTGPWNNGALSMNPYQGEDGRKRERNLDELGRYQANGGECHPFDPAKMMTGVENSFGTAPVGSYQPNAWGIYDTHGNVFEWCLDFWQPICQTSAYSGKDPKGPLDCGVDKHGKPRPLRRTMRGGSYWNAHYGSYNFCTSWGRALGNLCDPSTAHEAVGFRLCMPAAIAQTPQYMPGYERLSSEAFKARAALLANVERYTTLGLASPVYCLGKNASPLLAAKGWDGEPAAMSAFAFVGKGRVVLVADDHVRLHANKQFLQNCRAWLGSRTKVIDLTELQPKEIPSLVQFVKQGGGLFCYGRVWPKKQAIAARGGKLRLSSWHGNLLLKEFGMAVGDFCVRQTAESGFAARRLCLEGATVAPASFFEEQSFPAPNAPVVRRRRTPNDEGILVNSGETIAFLGDSITRLGGATDGYLGLVIQGLEVAGVPNVNILRGGIDGNNSGDMLGRIGKLLSDPSVKVITISCGVNDVWGYDWGRGITLEQYRENVRAMYDRAAQAGVQVIALTPTLILEQPDHEFNRLLDPFAEFIRQEAKVRNLPLADCRLAELEGLKGKPLRDHGTFTYDGVHPLWPGHKLLAREVLRALGVDPQLFPKIEQVWEEKRQNR